MQTNNEKHNYISWSPSGVYLWVRCKLLKKPVDHQGLTAYVIINERIIIIVKGSKLTLSSLNKHKN